MSTTTRNVYTIAERKEDILNAIDSLATLSPEQINEVKALVSKFLSTKGSGTSDRDNHPDTETDRWCSRFEDYYPKEEFDTNSKGELLGYTRRSQEVLTEAKQKEKAIQAGINTALTDLDTEKAMELAQELKALQTAIKEKTIYK